MFDWTETRKVIDDARRGRFLNRNALNRLINAALIDDFLFGQGLTGERALRFVESPRAVQLSSAVAIHRTFTGGDGARCEAAAPVGGRVTSEEIR
jgi:hypothetical protein